jgi:hypothetical protein
MKYPKHPKRISIQLCRREIDGGMMGPATLGKIISLSDKLDDYLIGLGYTSGHVMGIIAQLFTEGKVRVDFRNYTERLELMDKQDKLNAIQSAALLKDYIVELSKGRNILGPKNTQNMTLEPLQVVGEKAASLQAT